MREALKAKKHSRRKLAAETAQAATAQAVTANAATANLVRRNDLLPALQIELCAVSALKSPVRKLRKLDQVHIDEIASSISTLGFNVPLLIDKDNVVIDGESRLQAAKRLGLASVPGIRVGHLNQTEQRLLRLAVNRLGEKGAWDVSELQAEFKELVIADAPIEITGFGSDEIEHIITRNDQNQAGSAAADPAILPGASAIARVGDLFLLGPHRVICGNAADPDLVNRLMRTDVARMVLTDARDSHVAIGGHVAASEHRPDETASGDLTEAQALEFHRNWINAVHPHLVDGGLLGTFVDWRDLPVVHAAAAALELTAIDMVVWADAATGTGELYRGQHRLLPLFKKGSATPVSNSSDPKRGRHRSNVWSYSAPSGGSEGRQDHPLTKPTAMLEDALSDLTNRGELVLDPFLGAGSTLIAAQNTGRVCCGIELDPLYVDVIIRRYQALTGTAVLVDVGDTFEQIAARRRDHERR